VATATRIGERLGLSPVVVPGLEEADRTGVPFFHSRREFERALGAFFDRPGERVLGRESAGQAGARFSAALDRLPASDARERGEGARVVVSHATVMSLFLASVTGRPPIDVWRELGMPAYAVVDGRRLVELVGTVDGPRTQSTAGGPTS
jgi:broad specificity phosphatase PhoE